MTAKQLEQETGCKIMVRGKGSMRDRKKVHHLCVTFYSLENEHRHRYFTCHVCETQANSQQRSDTQTGPSVMCVFVLCVTHILIDIIHSSFSSFFVHLTLTHSFPLFTLGKTQHKTTKSRTNTQTYAHRRNRTEENRTGNI